MTGRVSSGDGVTRGTVEVDGIAETWFDDREAMARANASPEAKRLHDDGALFIGHIKSFIVEERFIIGSY